MDNNILKFIEIVNSLYFTTNHTGKMKGMNSLSTSPLENPICMERSKDVRSICHECYSIAMQAIFSPLAELLKKNTEILTTTIIPVEYWPMVNTLFFRLESFGDVQNTIQVNNYCNFAERNPHCNFAVWTKNIAFYDMVFKTRKKPENLIIIFSSHYLNTEAVIDRFPFVDKVFTVYTAEHAIENKIKITCGGRKCIECLRCYTKTDKVEYVNELLKADQAKIGKAEREYMEAVEKLTYWTAKQPGGRWYKYWKAEAERREKVYNDFKALEAA